MLGGKVRIRLATVLVACAAVAAMLLDPEPVEAASVKKVSVKKHSVAKRKARPVDAQESDNLLLRSSSVVVQDQSTGAILFEKNPEAVVPIASITKLMTAMVVLDAALSLTEPVTVSEEDVDTLRGSRSRLRIGAVLSREDMLRLALMSSENRAASALGRHYPGGIQAFVSAMNRKAENIGLKDTRFADSTGLSVANVSSARDLTRMVAAASHYPLIRELSTTPEYEVEVGGRQLTFRNTNTLVRSSAWEIGLSKTGYIREAGKCLVMQAWFGNKPMIIVLLDSMGRLTRVADAQRIKKWIEHAAAASGRPSAELGRQPQSGLDEAWRTRV